MKMMAQEMIENSKRINMTNFTIKPACMIIWTMSWLKALPIEAPMGVCVSGIVIIVFPLSRFNSETYRVPEKDFIAL